MHFSSLVLIGDGMYCCDMPLSLLFLCRSHPPVVNAHPRQGIFLPHARYEAGEENKYYTASTVCTLGRIFSDSSLIQPAWTKVVTSPWGEAARVTGGYGERLLNGANSVESPDFMCSKVRAVWVTTHPVE